ncbi:hypothetical protein L1987_74517 [Smallanthus sonchifolius]|uniref:Uncharacterized protein n=1 Tax=Smallanthus sonchifolius TaxID=185202 RepID=A0ACB9A2T8_9ASTR|nr:hypothetical protein L1987_74517 [Smallanthus sonchifolius]
MKALAKAPSEIEPISLNVMLPFIVIVFVLFICIISCIADLDIAKTSILKLQVGSLGTGRSLQRDLNRIAESADTSTAKGFNYVLQESVLSLLRHAPGAPRCRIATRCTVDVKRSEEECEKRFNQLSIEERGDFGQCQQHQKEKCNRSEF